MSGITERRGRDNPRDTMACREVQDALSDYLEGGLPPPERQAIGSHLEGCADCAREERELSALLRLLRERIPAREPSLDIWQELHPKVTAYMAEERLNFPSRVSLRVSRFLNDFATGAILFTQALAMNTEAKLKKYVITDPYVLADEEG